MAANEPSYKIDPVLEMAHVNGLLDDAACDEIADEHQRNGKSVRDIIVDGGYIAEDDLLSAMAAYNGSEVVALAGIDIPPEVLRTVQGSVARMYGVVPVEATPSSVVLAIDSTPTPIVSD